MSGKRGWREHSFQLSRMLLKHHAGWFFIGIVLTDDRAILKICGSRKEMQMNTKQYNAAVSNQWCIAVHVNLNTVLWKKHSCNYETTIWLQHASHDKLVSMDPWGKHCIQIICSIWSEMEMAPIWPLHPLTFFQSPINEITSSDSLINLFFVFCWNYLVVWLWYLLY